MTIFQALAYFVREATTGLLRSLRVSLLAILTIAVSLFLSGALFLASQNLAHTVRSWRSEARFVVYLERSTDTARRAELLALVRDSPWTGEVVEVSSEEAGRRFARAFPSLAELVEGRGGELPFSFEARLRDPGTTESTPFSDWVAAIRAEPGVEMVDADQDWIEQVETLLALVRGLGIALTIILLGASVFTIASVVRLTSFLYRDEIAVMRLVGATEFFIRGPFYVEGILQGLLGGGIAIGALVGLHAFVRQKIASSAIAGILADRFLDPSELGLLLLFGAVAGWLGAVISLGKESLQPAS
ncbi:MAG: permease-like cell division protein FtsX [Thermoanaerobaculia bacterium]